MKECQDMITFEENIHLSDLNEFVRGGNCCFRKYIYQFELFPSRQRYVKFLDLD